jgi:hypothetical protein
MLKSCIHRAYSLSRRAVGSSLPRAAVAAVSAGSSDSAPFNWSVAVAISAALVAGTASFSASCDSRAKSGHNEESKGEESLPVYRLSEVANHKTNKTRVWVTYGDGERYLC